MPRTSATDPTPRHHRARLALADALGAAGPGAPTLCEGWSTEHLAAHLYLREARPWALSEESIRSLAAEATTPTDYAELVEKVARRPARWSPHSWAGDLMNGVEFYVHQQDVVRATRTTDRPPADDADALWTQLRLAARLLYRKVPVGVILVSDSGPRTVARRPSGSHGTVVLRGPVGDLVLHAFGRGDATDVRREGSPSDVAVLDAAFPPPADERG